MHEEGELRFVIYILYALAENWKMTPANVYGILNKTGILDSYIIPCCDILRIFGKEYLLDDITEFVRAKGVSV